MKKLIFLLILMLACPLARMFALDATTPELQPSDMSFVQEKQKDGRIAGGTLVKVRTPVPLQFTGWIIKSDERRPGEYWVFLETAGGKLSVAAEGGHTPVDIVIDDTTPEQVYLVTISADKVNAGEPPVHISLPEYNGKTHPGFDMVLVKSGRFEMGGTPEQQGADKDEGKGHRVLITKNFYMGDSEVTQSLWEFIMGFNPSEIKDPTQELPVENITWEDAHVFCEKLSELTGKHFRLPTEAEWEYAARGAHKGTVTLFSGSYDIDDVAWYKDNSNMRTHAVKTKKPNELGIYDMSGNVWELCEDTKENYVDKPATDPLIDRGPTTQKVRRGGSWDLPAESQRVAFRRRLPYDEALGTHRPFPDTGMRLVMDAE